ncbi:protein IQ-DOMAIN 1-like [Cucurbita maxima]|uniref:Protein IQ-DOMAIN 1-like n=1 Tax=Cucurbita maxima TaxID=3661 RepID=A0A6J1HQ30_CUCMA|nr:protein IQ-DOMAIN 1-like [Cucurbita maxima]XP_022966716.1 protein IQ-DOMAIN 1-like [Cucurbita maxima]XP_022966717.1 protein IQ-DOMAIN 1-like [Cucurbita maxima]
MGKKGGWFAAVRKVLSNKIQERSKKKWFQREESVDTFVEPSLLDVPAEPPPMEDDINQTKPEDEPSELLHSVAVEPAVDEAQLAVDDEHLPSIIPCKPEMTEETGAIIIQSAFRGYKARKVSRGLKAIMRLRSLVQGHSVKRQVASTLKSMQTLAHVQSEVRARRVRMSEENQDFQRQLCNKREKDHEKFRTSMDDVWNRSTHSKAQMEAKLLNRQEAATRRERALAYAHSHQRTWKSSSKTTTHSVMDSNNPYWGWSWLERWMAARPWELQSTADHPDHISVTNVPTHASTIDIIQVYARRDPNSPTKPSPRTPTSQKPSQVHRHQSPSIPRALSSSSSKKKTNVANLKVGSWSGDDDMRSPVSVNSKLTRRHSIGGSSFRDDISIASLPSVSSYTPTSKTAAKARSRLASPSVKPKKEAMEKGSASTGSAKKRLSITGSPAKPRRLSSPPIVNSSQVH